MIEGIYAITPSGLDENRLLESVEAVLEAGVATLQLREKGLAHDLWIQRAQSLANLCAKYGAQFVLNDAPADVLSVLVQQGELDEAHFAVHVGRDDLSIAQLKGLLGERVRVGVSCYNDWSLAEQATAEGALYVAFGAVYPSSTKPLAVQAPLSLFGRARANAYNSVAIGGIGLGHLRTLVEAGADAVAVISGLFGASGPTDDLLEPEQMGSEASRWIEEFETWRSRA